jgi:hypothetical protein
LAVWSLHALRFSPCLRASLVAFASLQNLPKIEPIGENRIELFQSLPNRAKIKGRFALSASSDYPFFAPPKS